MYPSSFNEIHGIFVHQQIKELIKQGCEVKIVSPVPWAPFPLNKMRAKWKAYSKIPLKYNFEGIQVHYPRYLEFPRGIFLHTSGERMFKAIESLVDNIYQNFKFDIIHSHVALPDGFAGIMVKKKYKVPLIVTIHGQDLQHTIYKTARCRNNLFRVFEQADRIITVSTKLKKLITLEEFSKKVVVINNGIEPEIIGNDSIISNYTDSKIILSVSNLIRSKGIDFNLKAISILIKRHQNLKYLIIGDGSEQNALKKLASNLNLNSHVEFLGRLPHHEVMRYMPAAHIFSLPSWSEGFGMVYIEAMAYGKPVIAVRGEGIEDVITNGKTGILVKPKDVDSLAKAIDYLLSHSEEANAIGKRAKELVLKYYTWEENVKKTTKVYKEVLKNEK